MNTYTPFTKVDAAQHIVTGVITSEAPDVQDDVITYEASKKAVTKPGGYGAWRNVRAMHKDVAAGIAQDIVCNDLSRNITISAKIIDPHEWAKVEAGVYKGFSLGGQSNASTLQKVGNKTLRVHTDVDILEVSLVDRPANPEAVFTLYKATKPMTTTFNPTPGKTLKPPSPDPSLANVPKPTSADPSPNSPTANFGNNVQESNNMPASPGPASIQGSAVSAPPPAGGAKPDTMATMQDDIDKPAPEYTVPPLEASDMNEMNDDSASTVPDPPTIPTVRSQRDRRALSAKEVAATGHSTPDLPAAGSDYASADEITLAKLADAIIANGAFIDLIRAKFSKADDTAALIERLEALEAKFRKDAAVRPVLREINLTGSMEHANVQAITQLDNIIAKTGDPLAREALQMERATLALQSIHSTRGLRFN